MLFQAEEVGERDRVRCAAFLERSEQLPHEIVQLVHRPRLRFRAHPSRSVAAGNEKRMSFTRSRPLVNLAVT